MRTIPIITTFLLTNAVWVKWMHGYFSHAYEQILDILHPDRSPLPLYDRYLSSLRWNALASCAAALVCLVLVWRDKKCSRWIAIALTALWLVCVMFSIAVA